MTLSLQLPSALGDLYQYTLTGSARHRAAGEPALRPHCLLRGPRGRRPARGDRPVAAVRGRLGRDDRVSTAPLVAGPRRGRSDGHRAARHGAGLADLARADPPFARRREAHARRARRLRLRHGPSRAGKRAQRRRGDRGVRGADGRHRKARRQADRHGQPGAGPRGQGPGRLRARVRPHPAPGEAAGHPALAGRHVRPGAQGLLGKRGRGHGDGHRAGRDRRERLQGRRHQDLAAGQGQGNRDAPAPAARACACTRATTSTTRN